MIDVIKELLSNIAIAVVGSEAGFSLALAAGNH
jgi:hypothetical protein